MPPGQTGAQQLKKSMQCSCRFTLETHRTGAAAIYISKNKSLKANGPAGNSDTRSPRKGRSRRDTRDCLKGYSHKCKKKSQEWKKSLTFGNIIRYSTEFLLLCHACNKAIADTDNIGAPSGSAPRCPFWATARSHKRIKSWGAAIRPTAPTACMTPVASQPGGYVVKKFLKGALKKQNQRLLFIIKTDNYNFYTYI